MRIRAKKVDSSARQSKKNKASRLSNLPIIRQETADDQRIDLPSHPKRRARSERRQGNVNNKAKWQFMLKSKTNPARPRGRSRSKERGAPRRILSKKETIDDPTDRGEQNGRVRRRSKSKDSRHQNQLKPPIIPSREFRESSEDTRGNEKVALRIRKSSPSPIRREQNHEFSKRRVLKARGSTSLDEDSLPPVSQQRKTHRHWKSELLASKRGQKEPFKTAIASKRQPSPSTVTPHVAQHLKQTATRNPVEDPRTNGGPNCGALRDETIPFPSCQNFSEHAYNVTYALIACSASPFICIETICCVPVDDDMMVVQNKINKGAPSTAQSSQHAGKRIKVLSAPTTSRNGGLVNHKLPLKKIRVVSSADMALTTGTKSTVSGKTEDRSASVVSGSSSVAFWLPFGLGKCGGSFEEDTRGTHQQDEDEIQTTVSGLTSEFPTQEETTLQIQAMVDEADEIEAAENATGSKQPTTSEIASEDGVSEDTPVTSNSSNSPSIADEVASTAVSMQERRDSRDQGPSATSTDDKPEELVQSENSSLQIVSTFTSEFSHGGNRTVERIREMMDDKDSELEKGREPIHNHGEILGTQATEGHLNIAGSVTSKRSRTESIDSKKSTGGIVAEGQEMASSGSPPSGDKQIVEEMDAANTSVISLSSIASGLFLSSGKATNATRSARSTEEKASLVRSVENFGSASGFSNKGNASCNFDTGSIVSAGQDDGEISVAMSRNPVIENLGHINMNGPTASVFHTGSIQRISSKGHAGGRRSAPTVGWGVRCKSRVQINETRSVPGHLHESSKGAKNVVTGTIPRDSQIRTLEDKIRDQERSTLGSSKPYNSTKKIGDVASAKKPSPSHMEPNIFSRDKSSAKGSDKDIVRLKELSKPPKSSFKVDRYPSNLLLKSTMSL